jgi:predicted lipoprotein with Yx(FWY)xxD motif
MRSGFSPRVRRGRRRLARAVAGAAMLLALLASTALAVHLAMALSSLSNATLGERVVVNPQGRSLYTLRPESARNLLCKTSACLKLWPPLSVASGKAQLRLARGVQGHLGILRRSNGTLQVTLRGLPLYRYSQDRAKGQAKGEGVEGFGGTWHAVSASSGERPRKPAATTAPPAAPVPPSYPPSMESGPTTTPSAPTSPGTTTTPPPPPPPPPYPYPVY